jgi:hypothetical protein
LSVPHARGFLLVRAAGGVWGIANADVDGLAARGTGYRISACGEVLAADEILGVVEGLSVRPTAPVLRRFWSETPAGLAVYGRLPVVVVDPRYPPAALRLEEDGNRLEAGQSGEGQSGEGLDEARD